MHINVAGKILLVDDSTNNIELLSDILADDYDILFATSGTKALAIAAKLQPDLILLDIVMPEMDGYQIIQALKNNPSTQHIPVIFISAKSLSTDMLKGFKLGAVDYITKPFVFEEVSVRVKTHVEKQQLIKKLQTANQQLELLSRTDGLTGVANRRYFDAFLAAAILQAQQQQSSLNLILIDIDFFKLFNDHYGHLQGDSCLIQVAEQLKHYAQRDGELVARYGGEEFAIILAGLPANEALAHAQKCLQSIENLKIAHQASKCNVYVTISMGIVSPRKLNEMTVENMIQHADTALYQAKQAGRNQLITYRQEN
ncbi:MAG: diguanylate cyclase [Methyloprofundus sp.]|nr:diguanylate cyclase [Methyloprofundus sp.]